MKQLKENRRIRGNKIQIFFLYFINISIGLLLTLSTLFAQEEFPELTPKKHLRILSSNIQHLGARKQLRTSKQIDSIADRIATFDAAVLALQEIDFSHPLVQIRDRLGDSWEAFQVKQNDPPYKNNMNALLYDKSKVELLKLEKWDTLIMDPENVYPGRDNARPVSGVFRSKDRPLFTFRVVGIHFHWADTVMRNAEGKWVGDRIKELLNIPHETQNIILLGDFNEDKGWTHKYLNNFMYLLPKENGDVTVVNGENKLDWIYITSELRKRVSKESSFVIRPYHYKETDSVFKKNYSDHFPVFIDIKIDNKF